MIPIDERINAKYYKQNIKIPTDLTYYDPRKKPFKIYGLYNSEKITEYKRLPDEVAINTSLKVSKLYKNTAGGRIVFATDSDILSVKVTFDFLAARSIMSLQASAGFDVYVVKHGKQIFCGTIKPPIDTSTEYEYCLPLKAEGIKNIVMYMPLYNNISTLQIGLRNGSRLEASTYSYKNALPVVFYGSSITQGASASRCGMAYEAIISRKYNLDYVNLGFAGAALGEKAIVEYIANLKSCCFVCDYDHNAPTVEHLLNTHKNVYETVRKKNSKLPIIFVSRPTNGYNNPGNIQRRAVVFATYAEAVEQGDKNVWFVDGFSLFGDDEWNDCTVDGTHPNDLGFSRMATRIGTAIYDALKNQI